MSDKNKTKEEVKDTSPEQPSGSPTPVENEPSQDKSSKKKKKPGKKRGRKAKKLIKWIIIILVVALICIFVWKNDAAYSFVHKYIGFLPDRETQTNSMDYTLSPVQRRTISVTLTGTGTLQPIDSYTITSKVSGEVLTADFEEMQIVEKDQVLYTIDSSDLESNIRNLRNNVQDAQEALEDLEEQYEDLELFSDYSGVCEELLVEEGDMVQNGMPIARIVDKNTMLMEVPFFVQDALQLKVGQSAQVIINASTDSIEGKITKIGSIDTVTSVGAKLRTVTISVSNPGGITPQTTGYAVVNGIESAQEGSFKYNVEEQITAEYSGEIEALYIEEGNWVTEGELVLTISSENLDDQKENLEKSLDRARDSYNDYVEKLEDYTIKAPISGTVVQKNYKASDNITTGSAAGSALAIIYDMTKLTFDMNIDEIDLSLIKVGQEVEITSDSFEQTYTGYVTKKSVIGNTSMGTTSYPVTIELEGNDVLLPGMNVNAEIFIEKVENVLSVPVDAIMRGNKVRVLKNSGQASDAGDRPQRPDNAQPGEFQPQTDDQQSDFHRMPTQNQEISEQDIQTVEVETGVSDDDYVEIISGLEDGDVVVIENNTVDGTANMFAGFGGMGGGMTIGGGDMSMGSRPAGNMGGMRGGMPG